MPKRSRNKRKINNNNGLMSRSIAADPFLRCAFASVDFALDKVRGVPDNFSGRTVVKRHRWVSQITTTAANDTYFVFLPVPGMAYYQTTITAGSILPSNQVFVGQPYPDSSTVFPTSAENLNIAAARTIGKFVELIPTINATAWSGSVAVWKIPVSASLERQVLGSENVQWVMNGTNGVAAVGKVNYIAGNNMGAYAVATSINGDFPFTPIVPNVASIPILAPVNAEWGRWVGPWTGLTGHETIVMKVTGISSYTLKVHDCNEYQVSNTSVLYDYATASADLDVNSLLAYKMIIRDLPVAVSYYENPHFWDYILKLFNQATAYASNIPGPIGMAATGANLMGVAAASLFV